MTGSYDNIRGAETHKFIVPVGGSVDVGAAGEFVRCIAANADFDLSINGRARMFFGANLQFRCAGTENFKSFTIHNTGNATLEVVMAYGYGEISDDRVGISGTVSTNDVNTQAAIGLVQDAVDDVHDKAEQMRIIMNDVRSWIATISNRGRNHEENRNSRAPYVSLEGSSYAEAVNTTVVLVSAVDNTNGVLIKTLTYASYNSQHAGLRVDDSYITPKILASDIPAFGMITNIFIPPGKKVDITSTHAARSTICTYEVL